MCLLLVCRFFTFILLLFLVHSMGIALFRFLGSLCRNEVIASTGGSFFFLILLLVGGFLLAKQNIPDWWIWAYWSAPQVSAWQTCVGLLLCFRMVLMPNSICNFMCNRGAIQRVFTVGAQELIQGIWPIY